MKKIVSLVAVGILIASTAVAQESEALFDQKSFGVRGSLGASILSISEKEERELGSILSLVATRLSGTTASYSVDNDAAGTGGLAFWCNRNFTNFPALGIQGEIGFLFNNGTEINAESKTYDSEAGVVTLEMKGKISYTTMEVPILLTYTVNKGGFFELIPHGGFYLSFPLGKCKEDFEITAKGAGKTIPLYDEGTKDTITNSVLFGMAIGADLAINFSKTSALVFNTRYMHDFTELEVDNDEVACRSVFLLSAGYRYTF